jgi:hypothetical protein
MMGFRHVPLAAWVKCYIRRADERGRADVFLLQCMSLLLARLGRRPFPLRGPLVGVDLSRANLGGKAVRDPNRKPPVRRTIRDNVGNSRPATNRTRY